MKPNRWLVETSVFVVPRRARAAGDGNRPPRYHTSNIESSGLKPRGGSVLPAISVERLPFVCVATSDAAGNCDVNPHGAPAGFVRILSDRTLLVPERLGNRLANSLVNVLANPDIGLLFVAQLSPTRFG